MEETGLTIAIQGELGAFSHGAAVELAGAGSVIVACPTFDDLFKAAQDGRADRALVPIENSLAGSIHENYDRLWVSPLVIVAETQLRIRHCLVSCPGARLEEISRVSSHPVALAQCRRFFAERPSIEALAAYDTAGSVKEVVTSGVRSHAAIASRLAATLYGGTVLLEGIEDDPQNYTRFLLLSRELGPPELATKTSLVFTLKNEPGALHKALGAFATRGIDLAKIESRPLRGRPWEYAFYLDVLGDPRGVVGEGLGELKQISSELRVLGSYPEGIRKVPS